MSIMEKARRQEKRQVNERAAKKAGQDFTDSAVREAEKKPAALFMPPSGY